MKTETNILISFILNLCFSVFEFMGGIFTGSVSILSDALHDMGDAISIGISYFLEGKSKRQPDEKHTYGYARYSVIGGALSSLILIPGSVMIIYNGVARIINPKPINYDGMIIFAVVGVVVNGAAAFFTRHGHSLNQKAVNLHMLEDVLGWIIVLIGAVAIKFTDFVLIDPVMSIGVAVFILVNAVNNFMEIVEIFLEKNPCDITEIKDCVGKIDGVIDVHHIHIRSMDGHNNYATMHVVTNGDNGEVKHKVREELRKYNICHATLELEKEGEHCCEKICRVNFEDGFVHHHHH